MSNPTFSRRFALLGGAGLLAAPAILSRSALAQGAAPSTGGQQYIDITRARTNPIPIALPDFTGAGGGAQLGANITRVIANNLSNSGLFRVVDRAAYLPGGDPSGTPQFANWRVTGSQALVTGRAEPQGDRARI